MSDFATLQTQVTAGIGEPFIRLIRFPRFKNLTRGLQIEFGYPITALIGPNGTNKSSILRALQGCPNQYNIGDYWFDTPLDRIGDAGKNDPHRFIHGYFTSSGYLAEVIKARVGKTSRGADYFETSAPRRRDGMRAMPQNPDPRDADLHNKTRWKPIEKFVEYLDFRQELPAYDIMMHFNWRRHRNDPDSKKKRIRRGGPHVQQAIDNLEADHELYNANRILSPAESLSASELAAVSQILQRKYESIRLVKHDFFGVEGYTATMRTEHRNYSEAYAGSGEFAAIMLVRAISRVPNRSLILLDEPETSLHPGAQRELMRYIARECVTKHHQVVLATHSPELVQDLPDSARKLFDIDPASGRVQLLASRSSMGEAFTRLGASYEARTLIVEDELARQLVLRVARLRGVDFVKSIDIIVVPGGAETLLRRVATVQAHLHSSATILLDGDKRPTVPVKQEADVTDGQLQPELNKLNVSESVLIRDGGDGDPTEQLAAARRRTLAWVNRYLDYLPGAGSPEELLLEMLDAAVSGPAAAKTNWVERTRAELALLPSEQPTAQQILATQSRALALVPAENARLQELAETLARHIAIT